MEGAGGGELKSVANRVKQSELQTEGSRALGTKRGKTQRLRTRSEAEPGVGPCGVLCPRVEAQVPSGCWGVGGGPIWSWPGHSCSCCLVGERDFSFPLIPTSWDIQFAVSSWLESKPTLYLSRPDKPASCILYPFTPLVGAAVAQWAPCPRPLLCRRFQWWHFIALGLSHGPTLSICSFI